MPQPSRPWIVTRHDPLEQIDENLWCVVSDVPGFPPGVGFTRRMSIVRRTDGRLLFFNAVPVDEPTLAVIERLGQPAFLLVPHHLHCIDGRAFADKLGLAVYSAAASLDKVHEIIPTAEPLEALPPDPSTSIVHLPSSRFGEAGVLVASGARQSLLVCDIVTNVPHGRGAVGLMFRLLGFTGPEPRLPLPVRLRAFPRRALVKSDLARLADLPSLHRVVPSHGAVIERDAAGALGRIADGL